jgi:hypothetical protein
MGEGLTNITFERWVEHIFDHPVTDPPWYHALNREQWSMSNRASTIVDYLTTLFENSGLLLKAYTDEQASQGLWYISMNVLSGYFHALHDPSIPLEKRLQCIASIYSLFEQVFAVRCSPHLSHTLRSIESYPEDYSRLNMSCFMWWDNASTIYVGAILEPYLEQYSRTLLEVLRRILELDSIACQESALHGLGHYESYSKHFREEISKYDVIGMISKWLKTHKDVPEQLKTYALVARFGNVR